MVSHFLLLPPPFSPLPLPVPLLSQHTHTHTHTHTEQPQWPCWNANQIMLLFSSKLWQLPLEVRIKSEVFNKLRKIPQGLAPSSYCDVIASHPLHLAHTWPPPAPHKHQACSSTWTFAHLSGMLFLWVYTLLPPQTYGQSHHQWSLLKSSYQNWFFSL